MIDIYIYIYVLLLDYHWTIEFLNESKVKENLKGGNWEHLLPLTNLRL